MEINKKTLRTVFWGVAACIVLYWMLHETERVGNVLAFVGNIFSPFAVGAALAFILNVPMRAFEKQLAPVKQPGLRRLIAVLLTFVALLLVLVFVIGLLIPQISLTVETLIPKITAFFLRMEGIVQQFLSENPELMNWIASNTGLESLDWPSLIQRVMSVLGEGFATIANGAFSAIGGVTGAIVDAVISIVFALYCLFGKENLARQGRRLLYAYLPEKWSDSIIRILRLTNSTFSSFISGQCLEACILGGLFAVAMAVFKMPYIPLISVLIAVTALIPVVGAFVGCILGAFFILVDNPLLAVWFVVMFLVIQQIEGNMIYPKVVGTSIGLPGMWVLLAVSLGGDLMGIGGMLVMIPLFSVCYTLLREITHKRLETRGIDSVKLQAQPPEIQSKFKEKREHAKKRDLKNLLKLPKKK